MSFLEEHKDKNILKPRLPNRPHCQKVYQQ